MRRLIALGLVCLGLGLGSPPSARAVIVFGGDVGRNLGTPPGDLASPASAEGSWGVGVGTAISPDWFLTATHLGGDTSDTFTLNGAPYRVDQVVSDPGGSDLTLVHVTTSMPTYASIYAGPDSTGLPIVDFGRGGERGDPSYVPPGTPGTLSAYAWGPYDGAMSYATSTLGFQASWPGYPGSWLGGTFGPGGFTLSGGDSGGGLFVQSDGAWFLAGVNNSISLPASGLGSTSYVGQTWYATGVESERPWIESTIGTDTASVAEPSSLALMGMGFASFFAIRYRKRPIEVDAFRLGEQGKPSPAPLWFPTPGLSDVTDDGVVIHTTEGDMLARWGDYVIKGVEGEIYPCKPSVFEATYEPV